MIEYPLQHGRCSARQQRAGQLGDAAERSRRCANSVNVDVRRSVHFSATSPQKANAALAGKTMGLQAAETRDQGWSRQCSSPDIQPKLLPATCREL